MVITVGVIGNRSAAEVFGDMQRISDRVETEVKAHETAVYTRLKRRTV